MISLRGTNAAFCSTWLGVMTFRDLYVSNTFLFSLSTAALTLVGSRTRSALCKGRSFCWRMDGLGRMSVDLLLRKSVCGLFWR